MNTISPEAQFLSDVVMAAWTNDMIARGVIEPPAAEPHVFPVDADCPNCGWPERTFDTGTRTFGCVRCDYTSDERDG